MAVLPGRSAIMRPVLLHLGNDIGRAAFLPAPPLFAELL